MPQITAILEEIGLTHAQSIVYLALLELGECSSGPLIEKSKMQNSVVYNALHQLIEQGLVTYILQGKRKVFSAVNPTVFTKLLEEKKTKFQEILPDLREKQKLGASKQDARIFKGWKGVYAAFMTIIETLPKGGEYIGFAAGFEEQFSEQTQSFFGKFHKMRADKDYNMKLIANESARGQVKEQLQIYDLYSYKRKPEFRFVPGLAPLGEILFGDNVLEVAFGETPVAVIITSKQIAASHRKFFYALWKIAKK